MAEAPGLFFCLRRRLRQAMRAIACAVVLAALALAALPQVARADDVAWRRLSGKDAYGTMQQVVRAAGIFPDGSGGTVIVATGDGYWDALSATGLAGRYGAPILITPRGRLAAETRDEIARIRPSRILVMGGRGAVADTVLDQLGELCPDVSRVAGADAAETAVAIYRTGKGWSKTAIVATSDGYWDALSIAPYAYARSAPIFLTKGAPRGDDRVLGDSTLEALRSGAFTEVVIVGGSAAVSTRVEAQLREIGADPLRIRGKDALETSAAIATWELEQGLSADGMGVATAGGYWDALTGTSLCGRLSSVIVLSSPGRHVAIDAVLGAHRDSMRVGYVFGGMSAVPRSTWDHLVGTASFAGPLHVEGPKIVDAEGRPFQLRGISTHGLAWFCQYVNAPCFAELHDGWHANAVRLALYTEEYGGYCAGGDRQRLKGLVRDGIRHATEAGMYVIVDWHILSDGNPLTHLADAKDFFSEIAHDYGEQGNVIYEICNEPNGSTTWPDIKRYANELIPAIRAADPDGLVVVGTPTWSQEVDKALADPLGFDDVAYALHFYAATHRDDLRSRMVGCARSGLPILVTEFGICDASGSGAIDEDSADAWVAAMDSLDIGYCMWSLSNKAESASAIASTCTKTSGFGPSDLAPSGRWLYRTLNSDRSYASLPETAADSPASDATTSASDAAKAEGAGRTFSEGPLQVRLRLTNSWPNGERWSYQYEASVTNGGGTPVGSWQLTIPFSQAVALEGSGWNAQVTASGSTLTLASMDYNASLGPGASAGGIGFIVTSGAGLTTR